MLRVLFLTTACLSAMAAAALAGPILSDNLETCRNRQADAGARLTACENLLAAGQLTGKDLALALDARGLAALSKRDYDKAIVAFSAAHEAEPEDMIIVNRRGIAYESKGQDDLAMADYDLAVRKRPNFSGVYNNRGVLYLRKAALQSALDDFNTALRLAPNYYLGHINRGRVRAMMRDYDGALADYADADRIDPDAGRTTVLRCQVQTAMGKFDDAIANCSSALQKQPKYAYGMVSRAEAYLAKGDLDSALKDLNAVLSISPNAVRAHTDRGLLFEKRRDLAQARADYRSAAYALTPFDEIETAMARKTAQERLAALTAPEGSANVGRRIALVIGNSAYKNAPALDNPARDAKLIAAALRDVGFQAVTVSTDLARDRFFEVLRSFASEAEKADWAVIYYAGHGFEIGGVNYLLPVDAKLAADKDAEKEAVALEQVMAAIGGARRLRLVILDACRDNPFAPNMQRTIALKLVDKGFSNIEPSTGFMVVYAAKHGETALDGEGADSPFATVLARDIKEQRVEIRKLFDIVRDDVWTATRHQQQPFTYGSPPGREDFYFVGGK